MLQEAKESGDERLEARALYIWGCRQWRIMHYAEMTGIAHRDAIRDFMHSKANFDNLPPRIKSAVRRTYE